MYNNGMKYKKKVLKNGLRIVTVPMHDNKTVTVLVLVEAGSKYEDKKENGISHFLEHMCFKGTTKRPNAGDISLELDRLGAQSNAFTSHEFTGYYAKVHAKNVYKVIDIISDMYLSPIFDEGEIKKEKGVIVEEMNMYEDLPMRKVGYLFMELLYKDNPVGRTILGDKDFIKKAEQKDFIEYRNKHYVASATTVIVAGNIDEKRVIKDIEDKFEKISHSKKEGKEKVKEIQKKPELKIEYKKSDQSHLILGVRAFDFSKKDNLITSVLCGVLGAGMSSRLFKKLREEMGVCYYVKAENDSYSDHGYLGVSAGVDNKRIKEVVEVVLGEFKKLKDELVSEKELKKVKEAMISSLILGLESSDSYSEYYGIQEVLNRPINTPQEKIKKIKAITAKDIKRVANKIFVNESLNLAVIGPIKDKKPLQKILKF
ncbi:MAG: insulinase family protein [Candidatus Pacebacteria bacterium]|nr:insulinase family protein [Candidatus Paceibacterota bacterium]